MEYFAARFITEDAKEKQDTILTSIYNSEDYYKYINMLDIYYDIDYKGFSKNITLPLLEKFIAYRNKHYPKLYNNVGKELLEARIALLFPFCLTGITNFPYFKRKERDKQELSFFYENVKEERWFGTSYGYYDDFVILGFQKQENGKYCYLLRLILIKHPELFTKNIRKPEKIDKNLYKENHI